MLIIFLQSKGSFGYGSSQAVRSLVRSLIDEQVTKAKSEYHRNLAPWIRKGLRGEPRSERPATGMGSRTSDYHDALADFYRGMADAKRHPSQSAHARLPQPTPPAKYGTKIYEASRGS